MKCHRFATIDRQAPQMTPNGGGAFNMDNINLLLHDVPSSPQTVSFEYFIWNLENCGSLFLSDCFPPIQVNGYLPFVKEGYLWLLEVLICFRTISQNNDHHLCIYLCRCQHDYLLPSMEEMANQSWNRAIINRRGKEDGWIVPQYNSRIQNMRTEDILIEITMSILYKTYIKYNSKYNSGAP